MLARLELVVRNSDRIIPLTPGQTLVAGRTAHSDLQLDDPSVSRRHCRITCSESGVLHVKDLESANGTFVNERAVKEATARPGDLVRLGAAILEVRDPTTAVAPLERTMMVDEAAIESVIQRRIEPSDFEWLRPEAGAVPELALLKRAQRHLSTLHRVSELLSNARDIHQLSDATLRAILEVLAADRGAIVLRRRDGTRGDAEVLASRSKAKAAEPFAVSRTLVSDVIEQGVSVFAHDASSDARFSEGESVIGQRVRSVMCVPLRTTDEILGALYVDSLSGAGRFNEADLELLAAIGNQAGVAMHRVRLMGELERLLLDTIKAIAATIDARDGYTHRHSERVAALTAQLSREMGLSQAERDTAELSALLHDVGKIAVPDSILNKPGKLTDEEYAAMRLHPVHGARILGNIQSATVKALLPGVQYHHERWDGTGYPEGLTADNIPFLGRLLGVADFYDALTSARAYRGAMSAEDAIHLVEQGSGSHFDPAVAAALIRLYDRGELTLDDMASEIAPLPPVQDHELVRTAVCLLALLLATESARPASESSDPAPSARQVAKRSTASGASGPARPAFSARQASEASGSKNSARQVAKRSPASVASGYWCPMHPDVRSDAPGKCSICAMALVKIPPAKFDTYPVDLRATATVSGARLRLTVRAPSSRATVRKFAIVHERPMHLFVVGNGLEFFAHEHPVQQPDGVFMIDLVLPRPGPYMAIAEFQPEGSTAQMFQQLFTTGGALDSVKPPDSDASSKTIEGLRVSLDTSKLKPGSASPLVVTIADAATGAEVPDLEPYLGARAHMLMVSADLTEAVHGHPEDDGRPALTFTPLVPKAGDYKVWVQVQRGGAVITVPFWIKVVGA